MSNELRSLGYSYRANALKARKLIATKVTSNKQDEADAIASHMKHSVVTQRKATSAVRLALGVLNALKTEGAMNEIEEVQECACAANSTILPRTMTAERKRPLDLEIPRPK